ncbi:MAG: helix-turn-helix domain-containing protein [Spirochaetaceae bacterium]|nr:MAG: helix-turn-helix domain-containing protein [Spirochaetaceae bacterium]
MKTVAFVDDDTLVRAGLRTALDWRAIGFAVSGDYASAEDALVGLRAHPVDVVVTDIVMGAMSGLDLIEQLAVDLPHTRFVVLTSYEEFEYARKALRLGAVDYILKSNLDPDRVREVFERISRDESTHGDSSAGVQRNDTSGAVYAERPLERYLADPCASDTLVAGPAGYRPIALVLIVESGGTDRDDHAGSVAIIDAITQALSTATPQAAPRLANLGDGAIGLLLHVPTADADTMRHYALLVQNTIELYSNIAVSVFAAGSTPGVAGCEPATVRELVLRARSAADARFYGRPAAPVVDDSTVRTGGLSTAERDWFFEAEERIAHGFVRGRADDLHEAIARLCDRVRELRVRPGDARELLHAVAQRIERCAHDMGVADRSTDASVLAKQLGECREWDAARALIDRFADAMIGDTQRYLKDHVNTTVERAKEYVHDHFTRRISLGEVAKACCVNRTYLSRLFHKATGRTFSDYLTHIRIEEAKRLLYARPGTYVYEIALEVGYEESGHFSRQFREWTGLSPTEYRARQLAQGSDEAPS